MPELPEVEIVRQSLHKKIKKKLSSIKFMIKYLENLETLLMYLFSKNFLNLSGILFLKFLFLIITFFTFFCLIFLSKDCLTISTSGNSGI